MAGETALILVGNLVEDPELRFSPAGAAVARFRMASTPRVFDKTTGSYRDGEALFMTVVVWRQQAEQAAETLSKGMRVVVVGELRQRSYQTKEGENRTVLEVTAEDVAVSLKFATAKVEKAQRSGSAQSQGGWGGGGQQPDGPRQGGPAQEDVWSGAVPAPGGGGWGAAQGGYSEEPPF